MIQLTSTKPEEIVVTDCIGELSVLQEIPPAIQIYMYCITTDSMEE